MSDTDESNNHAAAVAAQIRLAKENGTPPEDFEEDFEEEEGADD